MTAYHSHNMTLYCDNRKNSKHIPRALALHAKPGDHLDGEFPMEFIAIDGKTCLQQAKEIGWYFHRDGRTVCPRCHLGGVKLKPGMRYQLVGVSGVEPLLTTMSTLCFPTKLNSYIFSLSNHIYRGKAYTSIKRSNGDKKFLVDKTIKIVL